MKKLKAENARLLAELQAPERRPPKRTDRILARHLQCEESQSLADTVAEAVRRSSFGTKPVLDAPGELLAPLI